MRISKQFFLLLDQVVDSLKFTAKQSITHHFDIDFDRMEGVSMAPDWDPFIGIEEVMVFLNEQGAIEILEELLIHRTHRFHKGLRIKIVQPKFNNFRNEIKQVWDLVKKGGLIDIESLPEQIEIGQKKVEKNFGWLSKKDGKYQFNQKVVQFGTGKRKKFFTKLMDLYEEDQKVSINLLDGVEGFDKPRARREISAINKVLSSVGYKFRSSGNGYYVLQQNKSEPFPD